MSKRIYLVKIYLWVVFPQPFPPFTRPSVTGMKRGCLGGGGEGARGAGVHEINNPALSSTRYHFTIYKKGEKTTIYSLR